MNLDFSQIGPLSIAILVVFVVYRRFRRNFGQQPLRPVRMRVRGVLLIVAACFLAPVALRSVSFLSAVLCGLAIGIALALWGAARTRFVRISGQLYYVPHLYTGIAVSLLFLGRLVYRLMQMYGNPQASHAMAAAASDRSFASAGMLRSPLTVGLFFVLAGYYVCYYGAVLWKSTRVAPEDQSSGAPLGSQSR
ncbi:MAG TPA: hypothetical protein VHW71_03955 [Steroidobacteraceae bacterium]|jgi:hypothetical protein|nr:hypothetical protein [Steroidobacteraceae bacterium]